MTAEPDRPDHSAASGPGAEASLSADASLRPDHARENSADQVRLTWLNRRREKIVEEIQRNRRGEYTVPTWVLVLLLALILAGWAVLIILS